MKKDKKYLLIIGAGLEVVEMYLEAKKLGLSIVGTDQNSKAPAFKLADKKLICSTRDINETLKKVKNFSKKHKIIGVTTSSNDVPLTVAKVAKSLNLKSISIRNAKIASNKLLMKNFFKKHNIASSKYLIIKTPKELHKLKKLKFPLIVKPLDGRGSRGVTFHENFSKFFWAFDHAKSQSTINKVLVEEYEKGNQLSVEGFVYKKKYYPIAFADRDYSNLNITKPYIIERGGNTPSIISKKIEFKINNLCRKVVKNLKINSGSIKFDIVINKKKVKIIEFALRLSGGFWSSNIIPKVYNINLINLSILDSIDKKIDFKDLVPKKNNFVINRYIFSNKNGKFLGIQNIKKNKNLLYFKNIIKKKTIVKSQTTHHAERLATFACFDKTLKSTLRRVNLIEKNLIIKIN